MPSDKPAVLIISSDSESRQLIHDSVRSTVELVTEATDAHTGLLMQQRDHPGIVFCDLDLPDAGGYMVLEALGPGAPTSPKIIAFSGSSAAATAVRAFRLGAVDYLIKPLSDPVPLRDALNRVLRRDVAQDRMDQQVRDLEQANVLLEKNLQLLRDDEESGRRLQFQLLPPERQQFGVFKCSHRLWTSLYLSGDFVDYFKIDEEHTGFYIADVAGHGASPAMITVLLKTYMNRYLELYRQSKSRGILDPGRIFSRINRNMLKSDLGKHLTMFYGVLVHADNRLHYANAGQYPYPILYDGGRASFLESRSKPLGLFDFAEYRSTSLALPEKFSLTLLSDGILELLPQSQLTDKLAYLLDMFSNPNTTLTSLSKRLGLTGTKALPDDVTLLQIRRGF